MPTPVVFPYQRALDKFRREGREPPLLQLHNLFDISRELTASLEEDAIKSLFTTTVMRQFVVSRCALYLLGPDGLGLVHERGTRSDDLSPVLSEEAPDRVRGDGRIERLLAAGPVLGLLEKVAFEVGEVALDPGDLVGMVTDGVTEALSPADQEFGDDGACRALGEAWSESAAGVMRALVQAVDRWTGGPCSDDLTALILKAL